MAMDLTVVLDRLKTEKEALERAIAEIERVVGSRSDTAELLKARKRRGRKSMGKEERGQVSLRMKAYWAQRREQRS
jgi:hypothetical protein